MSAAAYLRLLVRFALFGRRPARCEELPIWALAVPFRMWKRPCRYDGRTFEAFYTSGASRLTRTLLPLRFLYLLFLLLWPTIALARSVRHGSRWREQYRAALRRPDLYMFHPAASYTEAELAWGRPDFELGMLYAVEFDRLRSPFFELDDKRAFADACRRAGFPTPPELTPQEAVRRGGTFIAKDPRGDLGFGVLAVDAAELKETEAHEVIVQERLFNHPQLLKVFPADAPLSTLRVLTTLDPETREPKVSRCAIRIGRAGMDVDNTAQGGIWARIDPRSGEIQPGVTKKTFGVRRSDGTPVREGRHPDTGKSFAGLKVPWWDEGREMALEAHRTLAPDALTLGWDVGLAKERPVFLEVNVWTASYDYDPPDDAFTPACGLILARLEALERGK